MSMSETFALTAPQIRRIAAIDALRAPAYALGATMAGFATIAREAGFDVWMTVATSALVWGMPGQVAFASLYSAGASLFIIFVAVTLANMRMLLMVVSAADMMHLHLHQMPLWRRVVLMQFLAITSWAHLAIAKGVYPRHLLMPYFQGFSLTLFTFGMFGTVFGYFLPDMVPPDLLQIIIFITPIYIFLLIATARQKANRLAVLFGGLLCPLLYPMAGEWSILLAGMIGGTLAIAYARYIAKWHLQQDV
jgi:predicted branched-subunit amino acid permease